MRLTPHLGGRRRREEEEGKGREEGRLSCEYRGE